MKEWLCLDLRKRTHTMDSDFRRIHLAGELLITAPGEHAQPPLSLTLLGDAPRAFFVSAARHPGISHLSWRETDATFCLSKKRSGGGGVGGRWERSGADRLQIQLMLREADGATPLSPLLRFSSSRELTYSKTLLFLFFYCYYSVEERRGSFCLLVSVFLNCPCFHSLCF